MPESIYTECGNAARRLLEDPSLRIMTKDAPAGLFTELDVITLAAREVAQAGESWGEGAMRLASREASQYMGMLWRTGRVVRYGPIHFPGLDESDYMRIDSKIAYGPLTAPKTLKTPNGRFPRITATDDPIKRSGRRLGAARNDLEPWEGQAVLDSDTRVQLTPEQRENMRLQAELDGARRRIDELEQENTRLRERAASSVTRQEVEDMIRRSEAA